MLRRLSCLLIPAMALGCASAPPAQQRASFDRNPVPDIDLPPSPGEEPRPLTIQDGRALPSDAPPQEVAPPREIVVTPDAVEADQPPEQQPPPDAAAPQAEVAPSVVIEPAPVVVPSDVGYDDLLWAYGVGGGWTYFDTWACSGGWAGGWYGAATEYGGWGGRGSVASNGAAWRGAGQAGPRAVTPIPVQPLHPGSSGPRATATCSGDACSAVASRRGTSAPTAVSAPRAGATSIAHSARVLDFSSNGAHVASSGSGPLRAQSFSNGGSFSYTRQPWSTQSARAYAPRGSSPYAARSSSSYAARSSSPYARSYSPYARSYSPYARSYSPYARSSSPYARSSSSSYGPSRGFSSMSRSFPSYSRGYAAPTARYAPSGGGGGFHGSARGGGGGRRR